MPDHVLFFRIADSRGVAPTKKVFHQRTHEGMLVAWIDTSFKAYNLALPGGSNIAASPDYQAVIVDMPRSSQPVLKTMAANELKGTQSEEAARTEYWRKRENVLDRTKLSSAIDEAIFNSDTTKVSRMTEEDIVTMSVFKQNPKETII